MHLRSWKRLSFSAASAAFRCANLTLTIATAARMPMIVTTTISSMREKPFCERCFIGSPFVVMRFAVQGERGRSRMHFEYVVAVGHRGVGIVGGRERDPLFAAGHRVDEITLADETDRLSIRHLHALEQLVEIFRISLRADAPHLRGPARRVRPIGQ